MHADCYMQGLKHRADDLEKEPTFFYCLKPETSNIFGQLCLITGDKTLIFIETRSLFYFVIWFQLKPTDKLLILAPIGGLD